MVDNIQGLIGFPKYSSSAADQAQTTREAEKSNPNLRRTQEENSGVTVTISKEAMALLRGSQQEGSKKEGQTQGTQGGESGNNSGSESTSQLSDEEKQEVEKLKSGEQRVRSHEQAHLAVAGNLAKGGASYEYRTGPDGKRYVVGGEVSISMRDGRTPEETVQIAQQVQRAALAPADPSPQDRQVAADAAAKMSAAQAEVAQQKQAEMKGAGQPSEAAPAGNTTNATEAPAITMPGAQTSEAGNSSGASNGTVKTTGTAQSSLTTSSQQDRFSGEMAAVAVRGRQAFIRQGGVENSYNNGVPFSSMSIQA